MVGNYKLTDISYGMKLLNLVYDSEYCQISIANHGQLLLGISLFIDICT